MGLEAGEDRVIDSVSSQHVAQNRFLTDEHKHNVIMWCCHWLWGRVNDQQRDEFSSLA